MSSCSNGDHMIQNTFNLGEQHHYNQQYNLAISDKIVAKPEKTNSRGSGFMSSSSNGEGVEMGLGRRWEKVLGHRKGTEMGR